MLPIGGEMQNNVLLLWQQVNTFTQNEFGQRDSLQINQAGLQYNATQTFILPRDFTAEVSGFYQTASYVGTARFKTHRGTQRRCAEEA